MLTSLLPQREAAPALVGRRRSLDRGDVHNGRDAPVASSPPASPGGAGVAVVGSLVAGWTRAEIFAARTPALTARLLSELAQCAARVAEDAPQHLHSLRQMDDMVQEVRVP